jgi:hypothetical protein
MLLQQKELRVLFCHSILLGRGQQQWKDDMAEFGTKLADHEVDRSCWQVMPTKGMYCISSNPSEVKLKQMKGNYSLHGPDEVSVARHVVNVEERSVQHSENYVVASDLALICCGPFLKHVGLVDRFFNVYGASQDLPTPLGDVKPAT